MNPLDMMGPTFLVFYTLYGIAGLVLVLVVKARIDDRAPGGRWGPGRYPREEDAYHLALLKGGASQVAQALLGRLVSGGFARVAGNTAGNTAGDTIVPSNPPAQPANRLLPIERTALAALPTSARGATGAISQAVQPEADRLRNELTVEGLMPSPEQRAAFRRLLFATLAAIPGLGVLKLLVALSRGRSNVFFLILMIIGYAVLTALLLRVPARTRAGERYLAWLRDSHQGLLNQVKNGRSDGAMDLALAAGIFGLAAVPQMEPLDRALRPPGTGNSSGCGSGSSGCGSDSGGGDGGGGGCGGCGGGGD